MHCSISLQASFWGRFGIITESIQVIPIWRHFGHGVKVKRVDLGRLGID